MSLVPRDDGQKFWFDSASYIGSALQLNPDPVDLLLNLSSADLAPGNSKGENPRHDMYVMFCEDFLLIHVHLGSLGSRAHPGRRPPRYIFRGRDPLRCEREFAELLQEYMENSCGPFTSIMVQTTSWDNSWEGAQFNSAPE